MTAIKTDRHLHAKKYSFSSLAMLSLFLAALICLCTFTPFSVSVSFLTQHQFNNPPVTTVRDYLGEALERAASATSKTVIITMINKAYVEAVNEHNPSMLDLFLEGFWEGEETRPLVNRLLVVAMDRTAYQRCVFRRLHCYRLRTNGVDYASEKLYLSKGFVSMMWRRTLFLTDVLRRGYNFIFTDTDVMWLRNPFRRLSPNVTEDLQISTDEFNGDPWSAWNPINTGFYYVRSNNRTIALFEAWYGSRKIYPSRMKEQDVLVKMKRQGTLEELGLVVRCLDVLYFSGFCSHSRDVTAVATVHANCCKTIRAKVADLRNVLRDWRSYRSASAYSSREEIVENFEWSEHVSCKNSWRVPNSTAAVQGPPAETSFHDY
nr:pentatricopeptide repeat-containing protein, putative [Ipomoea batatas]